MPLLSPSTDVLLAIAERGTVSGAARALHMTQPAATYQLKKLEAKLGVSLFQRTPHGMVPTPQAIELIALARRMKEEVGRVVASLEGERPGRRPLRISSVCFTSYHWLPTVLASVRRQGELEVEINLDPTRRPFDLLRRDELDLVLTTVPPSSRGLGLRTLFRDEIVALVEPTHPLARREHLTAADFRDEHVITFDRRSSDLFRQVLHPARIVPRMVSDVMVTEAILEMVRAGLGVAALASWIAEPAIRSGRVRAVRITNAGLQRRWVAVTRKTARPNPDTARFIAALVTEARQGGWGRRP